MTNRFLVSIAALALIAGTGVAKAQNTGLEPGGTRMQIPSTTAPFAGTEGKGRMNGTSHMTTGQGRGSAHRNGGRIAPGAGIEDKAR